MNNQNEPQNISQDAYYPAQNNYAGQNVPPANTSNYPEQNNYSRQSIPPTNTQAKKKSHKGIIAIVIILLVLIAAGVAAFFTSNIQATMNGDKEITITNVAEYEEPGVNATFNLFGGIYKHELGESDIAVDGTVDHLKPGDYVLNYTAKFLVWQSDTLTRTVHVKDTAAPVITLTGGTTVQGSSAEAYEEQGYTATDDYDGDLTDKVQRTIEGSTIVYTVTDSSGNVGKVVRTVSPSEPTEKVIYLTFDDGPGQYTEQLLEVLAKYNVKATFFVIGKGDTSLIAKEAAAGHSIGVHSYTHDYATIYQSEEAYMSDFEQMESVIEQQTGSRTNLFRFPGGSSNTVSASYCSGIMTKLAADMTAKGYYYFDWNVSSGDAGETTSTDQVYQNIISQISATTPNVVLQHDIKEFSVAAVERVIQWGQANGYTFLPLTSISPGAHHGINN